MVRVAMRPVEPFRIGAKRPEAGIGAEVDRPSTIPDVWKILRVRVIEDPTAKRDEMQGPDGESTGLAQHAHIVLR